MSEVVSLPVKPLIVIALGGNAILRAREKGTYNEQMANVSATSANLAKLVMGNFRVVITHGNGPQVGNLLIQHAAAQNQVPALPMDACGAQSQGQIGYMMQQTMRQHLRAAGSVVDVGTLVTQVEVDAADPAFAKPTKPVGPFYDAATAERMRSQGYCVIEDSGRGYRRVVPSPIPQHIVEINIVRALAKAGIVAIAAGGGGVPVVATEAGYKGVEAVIDKDMAGSLLAHELDADLFVVLTDVSRVCLHYKQPDQEELKSMSLSQAHRYLSEGHFAAGSMGPKVLACMKFIERGGKQAIITNPASILEAVKGEAGTVIY